MGQCFKLSARRQFTLKYIYIYTHTDIYIYTHCLKILNAMHGKQLSVRWFLVSSCCWNPTALGGCASDPNPHVCPKGPAGGLGRFRDLHPVCLNVDLKIMITVVK